jgi:membrane protein required for colicin V production
MITFNTLDWILAIVIVFCAVRGLWRGAVSQVFGIAGVLGGFLFAAHYFEPVAAQLSRAFPNFSQSQVAAFLLIFFLAWFCISAAGFWLSGLLRRSGLSSLDRLMGLGVGLLKALVVAMILISSLTFFLPPQSALLRDSILTRYVCECSQILVNVTPKTLRDSFDKRKDELKRFWADRKEKT